MVEEIKKMSIFQHVSYSMCLYDSVTQSQETQKRCLYLMLFNAVHIGISVSQSAEYILVVLTYYGFE